MNKSISFLLLALLCSAASCKKTVVQPTPPIVVVPPVTTVKPIEIWTTASDQTELLLARTVNFSDKKNASVPDIVLDTTQKYQHIEGFGYTLTGGSATLINKMAAADRDSLLQELFGTGKKSIGVSYLRLSLGASDLSESVFSYDDVANDMSLSKFNLSYDTIDVIPLLQRILKINPTLNLMASPWSAPTWMKDNKDSKGGSLLPKYYSTYAQYFVKYLQQMKAKGISIGAVTIQNEPQHGGNNPSMVMSALEQADFIKNHLGPAFKAAQLSTKIIAWDHNCDNPDYPITVLNDAGAKQYTAGSAFHLYNGDISALSKVHDKHPDRDLYFTEQWTGANGTFSGDLQWHFKNVIIGSLRNWSKVALEWNLANDPAYNPHTPGGCTECKGALTINGNSITRNVGYYIIAQASKALPVGSVRIESSVVTGLPNVAFKTPNGKIVLLIMNDSNSNQTFNINANGKWLVTDLNAGMVGAYRW